MTRKRFEPASGQRVPGTKWQLVREVGRGGMGVTWEVRKEPGIRGVMKMIHPHLLQRAEYVARFFDEVRILTQLNHPNIVQVFDFDALEDGSPFFVMELLSGKTLADAMVRTKDGVRVRSALPARVAYEITRQTCEALYRAHSYQPKGVIHRDIKPENIFIHHPAFGEPVVKLLDFGVAVLGQGQRESGPVGTPRYMAPEQLLCEGITPKADLYAMALVLYEMLVGRGPFDNFAGVSEGRALAFVNAHLRETAPPPSQFASWIPPSVDQLILSALDKDPEKRPIHAYAFVTKLFELQFVNDGTPRASIDINTTAPTLINILEEGPPPESANPVDDQVGDTTERHRLPNDTIRDVPRFASVDPLGRTSPMSAVRVAEIRADVDRSAPTRSVREAPTHQRTPQHDTEQMLSGEVSPGEEAFSSQPPAPVLEQTPLTSEMQWTATGPRTARATSRRDSKRYSSRAWTVLMFGLLPALGSATVVTLVYPTKKPAAGAVIGRPPATSVALLASAVEPVPLVSARVLAPAAPAASPSVLASPQSQAASASAPAPSAVRPRTAPKPLPKPGAAPAAVPSAVDDGRDLLYVPPRSP